ncbi:MAG TPA: sugar kinase [Chloroflexia bacterium]|nr:sugar kinase [Chloroflexia bacterium]
MNSGDSARVVVLGDVITDVLVRMREPLNPASDTDSDIAIRAGGSGANLASWLAITGQEVHFVGGLGEDAFANFHQAEFEHYRVIPHLSVDKTLPTGSIVALIDAEGERSMLTDRGANLAVKFEDLPLQLFRPGNYFHLSGYMLFEEKTREIALAALRLAHQRQMFTSVDPSSVALLAKVGPEQFLKWTEGVTCCFPNLDEGRLLSGESDPEKIAGFLVSWYDNVALKLGAAGALGEGKHQPPVVYPAEAVKVVDTTGAGDAFGAGFLASWIKKQDFKQALATGVHFGSMVVSQVGARPPH